jgi:hypothetical protein
MAADNFGLLVNPKNGDILLADVRGSDVRIIDTGGYQAGSGYFDDGNTSYSWTYEITSLPRVHTPSGVDMKGGGYGTVLYTALCYAAHQSTRGRLSGNDGPPRRMRGDGISSGRDRSAYAERWWKAAKAKYGLAELVEGTTYEDFDIDITDGISRDIETFAQEHLGEDDIKVNGYSVNITGEKAETASADAYPFENALDANLILARLAPNDQLLGEQRVDAFSDVNVKALIAGNFGMLGEAARKSNAEDRADRQKAANVLFDVLKDNGASRADVDRCRLRFLTGVDDDTRTWQEIGDYSAFVPLRPNPPALVTRTPLKALRRGRRRGVLMLQRTVRRPVRWVPTQMARTAVAQYRANPSTLASARPAAVREAVERVHALRAELGWGPFMADRSAP